MSRVLFITSPEQGQANCHLSVLSSLLDTADDKLDLHLASYSELASKVPDDRVKFHPLPGKGNSQYFFGDRSDDGVQAGLKYLSHRPGFLGVLHAFTHLSTICHPESPEEYIRSAKVVESLLDQLKPDLVVLDSVFDAGVDAARAKGTKYIYLSPSTLKETAASAQGLKISLWPCVGSGTAFPLAWYLIGLNFLAYICIHVQLTYLDTRIRSFNVARRVAGYSGTLPVFDPPIANAAHLCMSTPPVDFPGIVPPHIVCCGPITQACPSLSAVDPGLAEWVDQGNVVLIYLGSHVRWTDRHAGEFLEAIKVLLLRRKDVRVLWKRKQLGNYELDLEGLGEDGEDRLRIVEWFELPPIGMMRSGKVICAINHGGSNSYHEALATGVPQIILASWFDCYDFAVRAEWLGIGKWGNRRAAPNYAASEVTRALLTVVGETPDDPVSAEMRRRAAECKLVIEQYQRDLQAKLAREFSAARGLDHDLVDEGGTKVVEGRELAAQYILGTLKSIEYAKRGR